MKYLFAALLLFFGVNASADVILPGEVHKSFKITNLNQFKAYQFSYKMQSYRYDRGYRPTGIVTVQIKNDSVYKASRDGEAVSIVATDKSGKQFTSNIKVGGVKQYHQSVEEVVEVYQIISIKGGKVNLKKVKEIVTSDKNGKKVTKEKKADIYGLIDDPLMFGLLFAGIASGVILLLMKLRKNAAVN